MGTEEFVYFVIKAGVYPPERVSKYYTRKHDAERVSKYYTREYDAENAAKDFNRWTPGKYKVAKAKVEIVEVFDE